ncbi:MAG: protein-disulfide reductase DsbD [Gammaproteobacteria bacterium SHHR-1]|uniref:protein-disulfide reductase DsbD n=1 Tax=Magnetovirga frankeli TaxID=947516 RepID=UPI001292E2FF|nr:protein-disulfide reductase DsbD [gamma proteobacterium SS-5]
MYKPLNWSALLFLPLFFLLGPAQLLAEEEFLRPEQAYPASAEVIDPERVRLRFEIAEGYYLYRDKISVRSATPGVSTGLLRLPEGQIKNDEFFGQVAVLRGRPEAELQLNRSRAEAGPVELILRSQGCADAGLCYPPHEQRLQLQLPAKAPAPAPVPDLSQIGGKQALPDFSGNNGGDDILPVEQAFRLSVLRVEGDGIELGWQIAPGTYLYQQEIQIRLLQAEGAALGDWQLPPAKIKPNSILPDGSEGDVPVYEADFSLHLPLLRDNTDPGRIALQIDYQGCAEVGICYPPQGQKLTLELPALTQAQAQAQAQVAAPVVAETEDMRSEQDQIADLLKGGSTWLVVLSFFGIGLLLALTPCVFPMIPILSGIIAGHGSNITTRKAFMLSLIYVLAMAVTYTVAGVLAGLFGENLQAAFQNPWVLWSFALIFVALAFSMFGYYDLQLPSSWQARLGQLSHRQRGGTYTGVAIMGLLSALIVGPCVAPPLAGALIYIGQSGDALLGGLALFAMSLGMGAPLIALGTGAGKLLPRAGAWMNAIKAVFGVMMLAVALLLLERVLDPTIAMGLWGLLLICSAVYMGALERLPEAASGLRKLWKGLGLALLIYGGLMLLGVALNGKDTLQPLRGLSLGGGSAEQAHLEFRRIKSVADLEREVAAAAEQGKPLMLDFYADWCTYCIQFEKYVFTDAKVQASLANAVLIQADVTANDEQDKALLSHLGLIAPPAILFWNGQTEERKNYRVMGYMDAAKFNAHVRAALR